LKGSHVLDRLAVGDLRSLGNANAVVKQVHSQSEFDELFGGLFHADRLIVMRAADAIEKITLKRANFLKPHKHELLVLLNEAEQKELKWHLASLVPRLKLTQSELGKVWTTLSNWALDASEGRIVRVNSIQGLFELLKGSPGLREDFELTLAQLEKEEVPSLKARIRILRKASN
jgi:hypothetical protein